MAHFALTKAGILLGPFDLSGDMNAVNIQRTQEGMPNDTFSPTKTFFARLPGIQDGVFGLAGLVELTDDGQDERLSANMSLNNIPIMVGLNGLADFDRVKFGVVLQGEYQSGGTSGNRAEWTASGRISSYAMTDGNLLAVGAKTGTFNGTARELGAISATQYLRAQIHAVAKSSFTSAVFVVQSAATEGGAYTTRGTFTTITDLTSQHLVPVIGPFTDTWWRIAATSFTGTSLTVYGAVGIS